jgi:hypothetical protein
MPKTGSSFRYESAVTAAKYAAGIAIHIGCLPMHLDSTTVTS